MGDDHLSSVDILSVEICQPMASASADEAPTGGAEVRLRWRGARPSDSFGEDALPPVRTAAYAVFAHSIVAWSGASDGVRPENNTHVVDVDGRRVREAALRSPVAPTPRCGALLMPISSRHALLLCGSDQVSDGDDLIPPYLLELQLELPARHA